MPLIDAHNHLHSERLGPHRDAILVELARLEVTHTVVNGTCEEDWEAVADLALRLSTDPANPLAIPAFGLHPWSAPTRSPHWLEHLRARLEAHPDAGVGEIGLDRWIEGHNLADQTEVFVAQLALATELDRTATIHCIQAWGALWEVLRTSPRAARGFLLHAYGGPMEMVAGFIERGAYFSFPSYFLHPRKVAQREIFQHLPADRILVETDAPDLRPPDEYDRHPLRDANGQPINHPANLEVAYTALAELRGCSTEALAQQVAENFARLFKV
jgi:TatD DNase family protein